MDAAIAFAELATKLEYEDIPLSAKEMTKRDILDTLGSALAGSAGEGTDELVGFSEEMGGRPESTILVYGVKAPSPRAALVNGFMARHVDYEDTHDKALVHTGPSIVPAAFAAAERKGAISGKEFIVATALGIDMVCRMGLARQELRWSGFTAACVCGYFGAALASSRILGLNGEQTINALGIAYGQAAGNAQSVRERVLTKALSMGCAARGGVFSALMAQRGITGARNSLEGDKGLFNVYYRGSYDPKQLTDDLGKRFEVANLSFKPYPCCRYNHTFIDLALSIARKHDIDPNDVEQVVAHIDQEPHLEFHPLEEKQHPKTVTDAQFSIPYCLAVALINRAVVLDDFAASAISDPQVIALAQKVVPVLDTSLYKMNEIPAAIVEVKTKKASYTERTEYPHGHPMKPMSPEDLEAKFRDCAAHAKKPLSSHQVSKVIEMVTNLEEVRDVAEIMQALS